MNLGTPIDKWCIIVLIRHIWIYLNHDCDWHLYNNFVNNLYFMFYGNMRMMEI